MKEFDLSIAIPYHGDRARWTMQSIRNLHGYGFVKEIIISPDKSDGENIRFLKKQVYPRYKKVKFLPISEERLYVFKNKVRAVSACKCKWVALIDSDNIMASHYIIPFHMRKKYENIIYCPQTGTPNLNYKKFVGKDIDIKEAASLFDDSVFLMLINTMNYIFHRTTWLAALKEAIESDFDPKTADSAYINYMCLNAGMVLRVMDRCIYKHTVHPGSFYLENHAQSSEAHKHVESLYRSHSNENLGSTRKVQARKPSSLPGTSMFRSAGRSDGEAAADSDEGGILTD